MDISSKILCRSRIEFIELGNTTWKRYSSMARYQQNVQIKPANEQTTEYNVL